MGFRSLIELNYDLFPSNPGDEAALLEWARAVALYVRGGDPRDLPPDVVHKLMRHSSEPCPLPPRRSPDAAMAAARGRRPG